MRRREIIAGIGAAALAQPLAARAQQSAMPVIGFLGAADPLGTQSVRALRLGLRDHGYVEGRNIAIEYRWGSGSRLA